jgi:hypothetical protein
MKIGIDISGSFDELKAFRGNNVLPGNEISSDIHFTIHAAVHISKYPLSVNIFKTLKESGFAFAFFLISLFSCDYFTFLVK